MSRLTDDATTFLSEEGIPLTDLQISSAERVVQRFFLTALAKDAAGTMALYSDESVIEIPFTESGSTEEGAFRRYSGWRQIAAFTEQSHAAEGTMGAWDIELHSVEGGRIVFVESRGNIIMKSGHEYRNRYVFRFDVEGDIIVKLREYYNPVTSGLAFGRKIGPS